MIELDGDHHGEQIEADGIRTRYLKSQGYRVIRFWNYDVETNLDWVLMRILEASGISEDPLQPPPHTSCGSAETATPFS